MSETLAFVMTKEPAFDALPAKTPLAIRNLLRRCLEKNPRQRLQHIGEARIAIESAGATPAEPVAAQHKSRERLGLAVVSRLSCSSVAAVALGSSRVFPASAAGRTEPMRFFVSLPETWTLAQQLGSTGCSRRVPWRFRPTAIGSPS